MSGQAGALHAPSATSHSNGAADTRDSHAARCAAAERVGGAIAVTPNERHPASGPGVEMQLAIGDASPSYRSRPRAGTVTAAILSALEAGRALTAGDVWRQFGTSRLASFVHVLKRRGWPIVAEEVEVSSRDGRVARVARYRLVEAKNEPQEKAAW